MVLCCILSECLCTSLHLCTVGVVQLMPGSSEIWFCSLFSGTMMYCTELSISYAGYVNLDSLKSVVVAWCGSMSIPCMCGFGYTLDVCRALFN